MPAALLLTLGLTDLFLPQPSLRMRAAAEPALVGVARDHFRVRRTWDGELSKAPDAWTDFWLTAVGTWGD